MGHHWLTAPIKPPTPINAISMGGYPTATTAQDFAALTTPKREHHQLAGHHNMLSSRHSSPDLASAGGNAMEEDEEQFIPVRTGPPQFYGASSRRPLYPPPTARRSMSTSRLDYHSSKRSRSFEVDDISLDDHVSPPSLYIHTLTNPPFSSSLSELCTDMIIFSSSLASTYRMPEIYW